MFFNVFTFSLYSNAINSSCRNLQFKAYSFKKNVKKAKDDAPPFANLKPKKQRNPAFTIHRLRGQLQNLLQRVD